MITVGLCLLSAAIAVLIPVLVHSGGKIFLMRPLLLSAAAACLVCALAGCFPRVVGYPLVLIGGLAAVWLGLAFLRFPRLEAVPRPVSLVYNLGDGAFALKSPEPPDAGQGFVTIEDTGSSLEFTAAIVELDPLTPLIGGVKRGGLTEIRRDGAALFTDARWGTPLAGNLCRFLGVNVPWAGVSVREYHVKCGVDDMLPGMRWGVYISPDGLEVHSAGRELGP
jgi:hypothetical protein